MQVYATSHRMKQRFYNVMFRTTHIHVCTPLCNRFAAAMNLRESILYCHHHHQCLIRSAQDLMVIVSTLNSTQQNGNHIVSFSMAYTTYKQLPRSTPIFLQLNQPSSQTTTLPFTNSCLGRIDEKDIATSPGLSCAYNSHRHQTSD